MKNSFAFADDIWYSFFFSLADCGHAAVIRCFLAPAYLPAFAKEAGLPEEKTTSKYWFNYLMGQVKSYKTDPPESTNEKKIIKQRIKALGTFLCDAVLNDHNLDCSDYLGKNRNVLAFPERYFQAIFPFHEKISENLLSVADTWYHTLLKTLYAGLPRALSELLSNLRSQNKKTLLDAGTGDHFFYGLFKCILTFVCLCFIKLCTSDGTSRQRRAAPGRKNGDLSDGTEYSRSSCNIRQYSGKYLCFFSPIRSRSRFRYFFCPCF